MSFRRLLGALHPDRRERGGHTGVGRPPRELERHMDFASYADRARGFDLRPLTTDILRKLARLFDRGVSLADLHAQYARELGSHDLQAYRKAREVWHEHQRWQQSVREMVARRSEAGRLLLPDDAIRTTWTRVGLALLETTDERLDAAAFSSHGAWTGTLTQTARHWQNVLDAALTHGTLDSEGVAVPLMDVELSVWSALSASMQEGDELPGLQLPELPIFDGVDQHLAHLVSESPDAVEEWITVQVSELLVEGIKEVLHRRLVVRSVVDGCAHFEQLLSARPLQGDCVRAVFLSGADDPVGLAVVQRDGVVREATTTDSDVDVDGILAWMSTSASDDDDFVVPSSASLSELVLALPDRINDNVQIRSILSYGLPGEDDPEEDARIELSDLPQAKAAVALAMRGFKPRRLWRDVNASDVIRAELGISLDELGQRRFVEAINEIRVREFGAEKPERPQEKRSSGRGKEAPRKKIEPQAPYNPAVKSLGDLEPGMKLKGRIANLNRFGAFVDVGIPKEGLIPMHALTNGFTSSPSDVVKNGQEVHVTVHTIDRARGRFDLSVDEVLPMQKG
jgi:hypothetical protein